MGAENLCKNKMIRAEDFEKGYEGEYLLPLSDLCIALTNRCNLYCIMCPFCSEKHENRTYNNEPPFVTTLDEYKEILSVSNVEAVTCKGDICGTQKKPLNIHFSHGESLLNPQISAIAQYTKEVIPEAVIRLSSNGTVSPAAVPEADKLLHAIDHFCFSIDGCTKETFEYLRRPAKFDRVLANLQAWSELAKQNGCGRIFRFTVTLSSINLKELPGLVRLAADLGGYYSVAVQPLIVDEAHRDLEQYKLEYVDPDQGKEYILQAQGIAKETGISLYLNPSIDALFLVDQKERNQEKRIDFEQATPYCDYFIKGFLELDHKGRLKELCCNMSPEDNRLLIQKYGLHEASSPMDLYNSKGFWKLRKDLLNGELRKYCKECLYCSGSYVNFRSSELNALCQTSDELRKNLFESRKLICKLIRQQSDQEALIAKLRREAEKQTKMLDTNRKAYHDEKGKNALLAARIDELTLRCKELEHINEKQSKMLADNRQAYNDERKKNRQLLSQVDLLLSENNAMMNSVSWKMTQPLRSLRKFFSKSSEKEV